MACSLCESFKDGSEAALIYINLASRLLLKICKIRPTARAKFIGSGHLRALYQETTEFEADD